MEANDRVLFTFAIFAYKQERYIGQAIKGAFAQTYSPLEILLSDDCSPDATFQIMQEMAATYGGPHQVILNRNTENLGIGRHVNRVFELAHGEVIVIAASDDVSLPNRVEATFQTWEASGRRALCIYSGYRLINAVGNPYHDKVLEFPYPDTGKISCETVSISQFWLPTKPKIWGCGTAYHRNIVNTFGPLPDVVQEDDVLVFRAACMGVIARIESELVDYRIHETNTFCSVQTLELSMEEVERQEAWGRRYLRIVHQTGVAMLMDLEMAKTKGLITLDVYERCSDLGHRRLQVFELQIEFQSASFIRKITLVVAMFRIAGICYELRWMLLRIIPPGVFRLLKTYKHRLRSVLQ